MYHVENNTKGVSLGLAWHRYLPPMVKGFILNGLGPNHDSMVVQNKKKHVYQCPLLVRLLLAVSLIIQRYLTEWRPCRFLLCNLGSRVDGWMHGQ